jgi:L,D-peptidoglycan transpeptidase YkuD (ErfK/YbiS/YcfS/YnhG family)
VSIPARTPTATPKPATTPKATASATAAPTPKPSPTPPAPNPALLVNQLASRGGAQQVVTVTSSNWTTDVGTLQTFQLTNGVWRTVFGAMPAHLGRAGFSADKHEGDDKTPTGIYGFGTMFGQHSNPGVLFPYRVPDAQSVWVDDPTSPYYNTWQENAALTGEHLASSGYASTYGYAVDIAYNTYPVVPGKGSAIFLHVSDGNGTAGCVSLPQADLLEVLRWLNPAKHPVIVMAPASAITQY